MQSPEESVKFVVDKNHDKLHPLSMWFLLMLLLASKMDVPDPPGPVAYGADGQIAREWRVSDESPLWLRQAALKGMRMWAEADPAFSVSLRIVPKSQANILLGTTPEEFDAITYMGPMHPVIVVDPLYVAGYSAEQQAAVMAHEMGHALCGCVAHHKFWSTGMMSPVAGYTTTYITRRDVELIWQGRETRSEN